MKCNVKFVKGKAPQSNDDFSTFWEWYFPSDLAYITKNFILNSEFSSNIIQDYFNKWITNIHPDDRDTVLSNLIWYFREKAPYYKCEYRVKKNEKEYIWILSQGKAVWNSNGRVIKMSGTHTDITSRKEMQQKLKYLSEHDPETGLPLSPLFLKRLKKEVIDIYSFFTVLYMNIDIQTMDTSNMCGENKHSLLMKVIMNMKHHLTSKDMLCRISENEYTLLLSGIHLETAIERKIADILKYCNTPFLINNEIYSITINIGVLACTENSRNVKRLLDNARLAMQQAKAIGTNNYCYYNSIIYTNYTIIL